MTSNNKEGSLGEDLEDILRVEKLQHFETKDYNDTIVYLKDNTIYTANPDMRNETEIKKEVNYLFGWFNKECIAFEQNRKLKIINIETGKQTIIDKKNHRQIRAKIPTIRDGFGNKSFLTIFNNNTKNPYINSYDIHRFKDPTTHNIILDRVNIRINVSINGDYIICSRNNESEKGIIEKWIVDIKGSRAINPNIEPIYWIDHETIAYTPNTNKEILIERFKEDFEIRSLNIRTGEDKEIEWLSTGLKDHVLRRTLYNIIDDVIIQSPDLTTIMYHEGRNFSTINIVTKDEINYLRNPISFDKLKLSDPAKYPEIDEKQRWTKDNKIGIIDPNKIESKYGKRNIVMYEEPGFMVFDPEKISGKKIFFQPK